MKILFSLFLMFIVSPLSASVPSSGSVGIADAYSTPSSYTSDRRVVTSPRIVRRGSSQSTQSNDSADYYGLSSSNVQARESEVPVASAQPAATQESPVSSLEEVVQIPEPSAIALMGLGLLGLVVLRRKVKS